MFNVDKYVNEYENEFIDYCFNYLKEENEMLFNSLKQEEINKIRIAIKKAVMYLISAFDVKVSRESLTKMMEYYQEICEKEKEDNIGIYNLYFNNSIITIGCGKNELFVILVKTNTLVRMSVNITGIIRDGTIRDEWYATKDNNDDYNYLTINNGQILSYNRETMMSVNQVKRSPLDIAEPDNLYTLMTNDYAYEFLNYVNSLKSSKKKSRTHHKVSINH